MKLLSLTLTLLLTGSTLAAGETDLEKAAELAASSDEVTANAARQELRTAGAEGLATLISVHQELILAKRQGSLPAAQHPAWERVSAAINHVGQQYDCHASQLFWHTDLEVAKQEAQATNKPILSLRMLGKLNEECSCANSRFFRTALYANQEISEYLRENYVLHWKSVRPVPVVTIDFGDGRQLRRTLTGNSIHYILDRKGRVVDGLPGLYGPKLFLSYLQMLHQVANTATPLDDTRRAGYLARFHSTRAERLLAAWQADLKQVNATIPARPRKANQGQGVPAVQAARVTFGKGKVELPILTAIEVQRQFQPYHQASTEQVWQQIAELHQSESTLDSGSIKLIQEHNPTAVQAAKVTRTKYVLETPLLRMVRVFQENIAMDTVQNEYERHLTIHKWFLEKKVPGDLEEFNEKVYAELFLTPRSDPWLGLVPANVYSGLENNGIVTQAEE